MTTTPNETPSPQVPLALRKNFLSHFLTLARWGLIIDGLLIAIMGGTIFYLSTSAYQSVRGTVKEFVPVTLGSPGLNIVITLDNGQSYDIPLNFNKTPTSGDVFGRQRVFIYRPDEDYKSINDLVQFTVFDSNGQNPQVFTTAEYTLASRWRGIGTNILIVGLVIAALAFGAPVIRVRLGKNKKQATPNFAPQEREERARQAEEAERARFAEKEGVDSITEQPSPPLVQIPSSTTSQPKRLRSPSFVVVFILLILILVGIESLCLYGTTGNWPWKAFYGPSTPISFSTSVPGQTSQTGPDLYSVAWSGSQFVAVGHSDSGGALLSPSHDSA